MTSYNPKNRILLTPYFLDEPLPGLHALARAGWDINQPRLPDGDKQHRMTALHEPLAQKVAETAVAGQRPVSIAGDCCTTIGVLAGLQRAGIHPHLIWFDAHGDFNDWQTSPSGFLGGMPLAMLVGRGEQTMPNGVGLQSLPETRVTLTDARDLDPDERTAVAQSAIHHLPDVMALLTMPLPPAPLYIHFDTDILTPTDAPAMNYLAPGGPSAEQLRQVFQRLADSGRVTAVSLSSWNPDLDPDGRSRDTCLSLLHTLIG